MQPLKPPKLLPGDLIGVIAPASPAADATRIDRGVGYLERLGYRVTVGASALKTHGYLAGSDDERLADLHAMFRDKRVRAIICVRGGYGTPRLLRHIDYAMIRRNPKILIGFSDITALQMALWTRCGLVTFHGPMLATDLAEPMDGFTEEYFWRFLTSDRAPGLVTIPEDHHAQAIVPGKIDGRLLGGNLSLIASLAGTPYLPSFTRSALFLEEIGEEPYRVDRMLMQLENAGILKACSGMLLGQFSDCGARDASKPSLTLDQVVEAMALSAQKPVISNLPFGHFRYKLMLPVGARVKADSASPHTLLFPEAAVR